MSRTQTDQVIDEEESETCPLCIEEMDLQDRHYQPCPCGYQICFFCYNNIKSTMNGLCPACRRPYDDVPVFDEPSAEEKAQERERQAAQAKRKAAAKQKEAQKREADTLSRKHLAGIRVRQKNLVYVTGMRPNISDSQLSELLRQDEYFGQYGKIVKVVVSKAKENHPNNSVGVYVTFARREDAERCIQMVDGSENIDGRLRAQYGTTKYCSSYIRGETCANRQCMFLHEPGEENESFTRQDLSSLNVASTQSPTQANSESPEPQPQPPSQQAPIAAASTLMERKGSKDKEPGQFETPERPALPSSASWANRIPHTQSANRSSEISNASPATQSVDTAKFEPPSSSTDSPSVAASSSVPNAEESPESSHPTPQRRARKDPSRQLLGEIKTVVSNEMEFVFDEDALEPRILQLVKAFPALFDANGGAKRQISKQSEIELHHQQTDNQVARQTLSAIEVDETAEGGSLQLGGEPEDRQDLSAEQQRHVIQPPAQDNASGAMFGQDHPFSPTNTSETPNLRGAMLPQQQQQQYLLSQFKSASPSFPNQTQTAQSGYPNTQTGGQGHSRQASRFSFANDTSASTSVKPVTDRKMMNQQSAMMPPQQSGQYSQYSQQQQGNKFFSSGVQGPPPGLKATGTPPVSGGGMFGQGHGFATAGLGYGVNATRRNPNDEMLHDLIRARGGSAGSGQTSDGGRREYMFSSPFLHNTSSQSSTPAPAPGISSFPYGPHPGAFQDHGPQKQKKKGKKHRHANTSSSGGGVVDLADPSILQARMHSAGQSGLYGNQGGQGQGGFNSMMYGSNGYGRGW